MTKPVSILVTALSWVLLLATPGAAQEHSRSDLEDTATEQEGRGEFELVLIHGLGGNATIWEEVLPFLKNTFKVEVFEFSGHGDTQPMSDISIDSEVQRLQAFIAKVGFTYPTLVGHGMGGMVAMQYALDHPADVHRLIVIDSAPMQLAADEQKASITKKLLTNYDEFVASRYLHMSDNPDITEKVVDMALRTDSASFISLLMSGFDYDVTSRLGDFSVPMLVIGSELMFPATNSSQHLLEHYGFNHARTLSFKRMPNVGHYVMLEYPVLTASVLLAFGVTADYVFDQ
ncbi:MAG: pimeloyl-ACP methyl ester carboxylesterase [Candidatus Krumholzibacteriia bacterium]|jgi:pimeloyl-ACP methyl ester carboxylesterase